ncbi:semaphorin-4A isoform X1 [Electrophorus electricus]|uniref:Sema domain-containing protein n=1 Tax=Electrophorus electricus TaxID=8005 RepID=A0A4W4G3F3_ELEEL|nr:semaphorin-4A isoform X1 [Electrophorus electricus]
MTSVNGFCNICVLLFGILHLSKTITPRTSFLFGTPGRVLSRFNASDVQNTTTLLLSPDAATLFVGGRDTVLSLDVSQSDGITLKNKFDWEAPKNPECNSLAFNQNCANFIRILQFINSTHLYACGSWAFKPQYTILTVDSLKVSKKPEHVKGHCPYNASERSTALVVDGKLYTATTNDYFGKTPVISRYFSDDKNDLQLSDNSRVQKGATFISSSYIPSEGKVLFFFREAGTEYNFMNKFTVTRVAQVCIDDNGGERVLQKRWTSFAKSHLVCQAQEQLPFNLLQDIVTVPAADAKSPDNTLFYGIFTSQWALTSGQSAVCAFRLADIKAAFSANYKTYIVETGEWKVQRNRDAILGKCGLHNASDHILNLVKKSFLTVNNIQAVGHKQLLTSKEELYSRITAQRVQAANGRMYTILYLLTESGFLHKIVLLKDGYHIIEAIQLFKSPQTIKSILVSIAKGMVFVGSSEGVIRVPVSNCSFYSSCAECVLAQDPFCGWNSQSKKCIQLYNVNPNLCQDVENGNFTDQCKDSESGTLVPRKVIHAHHYEWVMLPCASSSGLERVSWRFSNHSIVPQSHYLQQRKDNLLVLVTPNTAVEFHCVSEKQGLQRTLAVFSLKPHSLGSSNHSVHSLDEDTLNSSLPLTQPKNYYVEMVVVSFLLVLCMCVLAVSIFCVQRQSRSTASPECNELSRISSAS